MLNDEQRAACVEASAHPEGEISQDEFDAFLAGIVYERERVIEECAVVCDELAVTTSPVRGPMFAAAIRALKGK